MNDLNKKAKLLGISIAAAGLFAMGSAAQAATITGVIGFVGSASFKDGATLNTGSTVNNNLGAATQVLFTPGNQAVGFNSTKSGTYSPIAQFTSATFKSFLFTTAPITDLWKVVFGGKTYSFDLGTKPLVKSYTASTGTLGLSGVGLLHATGYTDTQGVFNFSTQNGNSTEITFSASSTVPVPAALFFAAPALLGVFGVSRRKNAAGSAA